jgi:ankyrin repeat protein
MRRLALLALLLTLLLTMACVAKRSSGSPLVDAVRSGDVAAVRALCAGGADPNEPAGGNDWPPLIHAIHKNQLGTAAALLDAGADVNHADASGMTALMMAAGYGHRDMVALLLRRGANAHAADRHGEAAIDYALTGMTDIDEWTYFRCQNEAAALLKPASPAPSASSKHWAHVKGCA